MEGRTTVIEVHVAEGDMGKVIGKQGRIAKAIRSVVKGAACKRRQKGSRRYHLSSDVCGLQKQEQAAMPGMCGTVLPFL